VRERMKSARGAGLGDPEDAAHEDGTPGSPEALTLALQAITREASALRRAVAGGQA